MCRVCVSCTSAITLGYSSAAYIDFLIGKLDTQSSLYLHTLQSAERKNLPNALWPVVQTAQAFPVTFSPLHLSSRGFTVYRET